MANPMLHPMNMSLMQGPAPAPSPPPQNSMQAFFNNPLTSVAMGLLGGNYGPNSRSAFANAMKGGMLGMQQAGVSQARNAQTQMLMAAAAKKKKEEEQMRQWAASKGLPANIPEWALKARYEAEVKSQFPGAQGFGTTVQYVHDRQSGKVLPAQASNTGGVFIVMPDGSKQPFDPAKHELIKPYTMQNFGGYQAPFQPLSGQVGAGVGAPAGGGGPMPQPVAPPFVDAQGNAPSLAPGEVLSPQSQYRPAGMPPGAIPNTLKPGERPDVQAAQTAAKKAAEIKATSQAEAQVDLPGAGMDLALTKDYIKELRTHPGLSSATGLSGAILPVIPGSTRADFEARKEQLIGGQFLQAYQQLKGGGQITEVEGKKAEQAIARMQAAVSKEAFLTALKDYERAIEVGFAKLKGKAGAPTTGGWKIEKVN